MTDDMPQDGRDIKSRKRKSHETDPWYKRYPRDFYEDTRELKPDERGIYNDIVDLIYMAEGPIPDDPRALSHKLFCDTRVWLRIRSRLLATGKLFITRGKLHNKRCQEVLATRELERRSKGRCSAPTTYVQCDLFGKDNEINDPMRVNSPYIEIDKESKKDNRSFEPRVIDGGKSQPAMIHRFVSEAALDQVRSVAPGWDRQALLRKFMDWPESKTSPTDMDTLFIRWARKYTKGKKAQ